MNIQKNISNLFTGFIAGLILITVLLNNNTGYTITDCVHIWSISKNEDRKIASANHIKWKYGSIEKKQSTIRKYLKAHKTKRERERELYSNDLINQPSQLFEITLKTQIRVSFIDSYLLDNFLLRGPPSFHC